jgi:two-component system chemotaxis sensor kinase CheA
MDIVRTNIEKLNGLIDVETRPGAGTKFTIQLPLTLAIVSGLLIKLGHLTYALPMSSVVEIVRIPQSDITYVKGRPVVQIREQVMPLAWLHDHFRIPRARHARRNVFVVVVGVAEKRLGLVVDELMGNQEIVVKSIGSYVGKVDGVSGATILGDGSVALILDVVGLMKLALHEDGPVIEEARTAANG